MDRKYLMTALGYAIVGVALGIHMASSQNHGQLVTHAHIMLVGFVVSFVYALCHKLWLNEPSETLNKLQFYSHQIGTAGLVISFFLQYGNILPLRTIAPILAVSSILVFIALILMKVLVIKSK